MRDLPNKIITPFSLFIHLTFLLSILSPSLTKKESIFDVYYKQNLRMKVDGIFPKSNATFPSYDLKISPQDPFNIHLRDTSTEYHYLNVPSSEFRAKNFHSLSQNIIVEYDSSRRQISFSKYDFELQSFRNFDSLEFPSISNTPPFELLSIKPLTYLNNKVVLLFKEQHEMALIYQYHILIYNMETQKIIFNLEQEYFGEDYSMIWTSILPEKEGYRVQILSKNPKKNQNSKIQIFDFNHSMTTLLSNSIDYLPTHDNGDLPSEVNSDKYHFLMLIYENVNQNIPNQTQNPKKREFYLIESEDVSKMIQILPTMGKTDFSMFYSDSEQNEIISIKDTKLIFDRPLSKTTRLEKSQFVFSIANGLIQNLKYSKNGISEIKFPSEIQQFMAITIPRVKRIWSTFDRRYIILLVFTPNLQQGTYELLILPIGSSVYVDKIHKIKLYSSTSFKVLIDLNIVLIAMPGDSRLVYHRFDNPSLELKIDNLNQQKVFEIKPQLTKNKGNNNQMESDTRFKIHFSRLGEIYNSKIALKNNQLFLDWRPHQILKIHSQNKDLSFFRKSLKFEKSQKALNFQMYDFSDIENDLNKKYFNKTDLFIKEMIFVSSRDQNSSSGVLEISEDCGLKIDQKIIPIENDDDLEGDTVLEKSSYKRKRPSENRDPDGIVNQIKILSKCSKNFEKLGLRNKVKTWDIFHVNSIFGVDGQILEITDKKSSKFLLFGMFRSSKINDQMRATFSIDINFEDFVYNFGEQDKGELVYSQFFKINESVMIIKKFEKSQNYEVYELKFIPVLAEPFFLNQAFELKPEDLGLKKICLISKFFNIGNNSLSFLSHCTQEKTDKNSNDGQDSSSGGLENEKNPSIFEIFILPNKELEIEKVDIPEGVMREIQKTSYPLIYPYQKDDISNSTKYQFFETEIFQIFVVIRNGEVNRQHKLYLRLKKSRSPNSESRWIDLFIEDYFQDPSQNLRKNQQYQQQQQIKNIKIEKIEVRNNFILIFERSSNLILRTFKIPELDSQTALPPNILHLNRLETEIYSNIKTIKSVNLLPINFIKNENFKDFDNILIQGINSEGQNQFQILNIGTTSYIEAKIDFKDDQFLTDIKSNQIKLSIEYKNSREKKSKNSIYSLDLSLDIVARPKGNIHLTPITSKNPIKKGVIDLSNIFSLKNVLFTRVILKNQKPKWKRLKDMKEPVIYENISFDKIGVGRFGIKRHMSTILSISNFKRQPKTIFGEILTNFGKLSDKKNLAPLKFSIEVQKRGLLSILEDLRTETVYLSTITGGKNKTVTFNIQTFRRNTPVKIKSLDISRNLPDTAPIFECNSRIIISPSKNGGLIFSIISPEIIYIFSTNKNFSKLTYETKFPFKGLNLYPLSILRSDGRLIFVLKPSTSQSKKIIFREFIESTQSSIVESEIEVPFEYVYTDIICREYITTSSKNKEEKNNVFRGMAPPNNDRNMIGRCLFTQEKGEVYIMNIYEISPEVIVDYKSMYFFDDHYLYANNESIDFEGRFVVRKRSIPRSYFTMDSGIEHASKLVVQTTGIEYFDLENSGKIAERKYEFLHPSKFLRVRAESDGESLRIMTTDSPLNWGGPEYILRTGQNLRLEVVDEEYLQKNIGIAYLEFRFQDGSMKLVRLDSIFQTVISKFLIFMIISSFLIFVVVMVILYKFYKCLVKKNIKLRGKKYRSVELGTVASSKGDDQSSDSNSFETRIDTEVQMGAINEDFEGNRQVFWSYGAWFQGRFQEQINNQKGNL